MPLHWLTAPPSHRRRSALTAILIFGISAGAARQVPSQTISGPHIAGCPIFPADNIWNVPIDNLPLLPRSQDYIAGIGPDKGLHPDFGANGGMPITVIDSTVKPVKVTFQYAADSDPGNYPIPPNALLEGGQNAPADSDRHVLLVDKDHCMLFELWAATRQSDTAWKAGSGIRMDLNSNALREDGKTSADAAGLPVLPGLVRYDEVASGEIRHALRFTVPRTQADHVWPARHDASNLDDPKFPPLGVRFRLRAGFDISGFSKTNQVILIALKRYGMFLADNGAAWFLSGSPDPRWNDDDLHLLLNVKGSDFEAVDESRLRAQPNSARANPAAQK